MRRLYRDKHATYLRDGDRVFRSTSPLVQRLFVEDVEAIVQETIEQGEIVEPSSIDWDTHHWLPPVAERTEIWAAGVTYFRSRVARMEESDVSGGKQFYDMVYEAARPELFFKSNAWTARGHCDLVRCRDDSTWDVPEPELTLAINCRGEIFGYTIGNDMSSRSIEGENPLYLPQAKTYRGSCAVGPCLLLGREALPPAAAISITISRSGEQIFTGATDVTQIRRDFAELAEFLYRENEFVAGALLLTGTGIVPESDFTLQSGDAIEIAIDGIGKLFNNVE